MSCSNVQSLNNWQVLKALLDVSWVHAWADEVHSRIIRMACNLLYCLPALPDVDPSSKPKLDTEQLSLLGGIESICIEVGMKGSNYNFVKVLPCLSAI
jgi:hypothetical protein